MEDLFKKLEGLLNVTDNELKTENSNKNIYSNSAQRDYMAGLLSISYAESKLLSPRVKEFHNNRTIYVHDIDYYANNIFNCAVIDLEDMLKNGVKVHSAKVSTPRGIDVACNVTAQIIHGIALGQYGGISIHNLPETMSVYAEKTYHKEKAKYLRRGHSAEESRVWAYEDTLKEIENGVQSIFYEINTLLGMGQPPFITCGMWFNPNSTLAHWSEHFTIEFYKQRMKGLGEDGEIPTFPKLIQPIKSGVNKYRTDRYYNIKQIAMECTAKTMYPDYVSYDNMEEWLGHEVTPMGCRSFLSPFKDVNGNLKTVGRFNMGVISLNLPQLAIRSKGDVNEFYRLLDEALEVAYEGLLGRYEKLKGVKSDISPLHWQYGAISRLNSGESIDKLLEGGYATISLGYIGLHEVGMALFNKPFNLDSEVKDFLLDIVKYLKQHTDKWKEETNLGFGLYGTPSETLCHRFASFDKAKYGEISGVTDKTWYTNSFHVDVEQEISPFDKILIESEFQRVSTGGFISYIEMTNLTKNLSAFEQVLDYAMEHTLYMEFNTKVDACFECGFKGEFQQTKNSWKCPNCGNDDDLKFNVVRRTCGYLGNNNWNKGKHDEMSRRYVHI